MSGTETVFLVQALTCTALAVAGYLLSIFAKRVLVAKISTWILTAAFGFLTVNLVVAAVNWAGWDQFGSRHFLAFYAWATAGIYLGLQLKTKTRVLGVFVAPLILLLLIAAAGLAPNRSLVPPEWKGGLTTLHLVLSIAGEALFVLASAAGAMFLMQNRLIKSKKRAKMSKLLPSLGDLDKINFIGLMWGFVLLTAGVVTGTVYAVFVWEGAWLSDPRVVWSFAVWIAYGFLLHQRLAIGWGGVRMAALSVLIFMLFAVSAVAVRFCLPSMHSFI